MKAKRADPRMRKGLLELIDYTRLHQADMVEVGSYAGEAALIFAESTRFRSVTCVDHWLEPDVEAAFDAQTADTRLIRKVKATSVDAAQQFADESLDLVYLDAAHDLRSIRADIRAWTPKVKPKGWIAGHDYTWRFKAVQQAVWEELGPPRAVFRDGSWLVRKK